MNHPIITSMIVDCKACGKIHESMPIAMPISDGITAVFFSCQETHSVFISDAEKERLDKEFKKIEKEERRNSLRHRVRRE